MSTEEELRNQIKVLSENVNSELTRLHGLISNLEVRHNQTKEFNYRDIAALQKRCDEIENPDIYFQVVRRER